MSLPDDQIILAVVFYEKLGEGLLEQWEKIDLMVNICRNGWEFLIHKIISYWNKQNNFGAFSNLMKAPKIDNR